MSQKAREEELKDIEDQIDKFIKLIPTTKFDSVRERYEAEVEELDKRAKLLKTGAKIKKEPNSDEALNLMIKFLGTPAETWKKLDRNLKIMVHNMIFEENPKYSLKTGFGTPKLSLPFSVNRDFFTNNVHLVVCSRFCSNYF